MFHLGLISFVLFRQTFSNDIKWNNTNSSDIVSSAYPSLKIPLKSESFFINPCGPMAGKDARKGVWGLVDMENHCNGENGGLLFIYDKTDMTRNYSGQVFSISAFNQLTAMFSTKTDDQLMFGLPSTVKSTQAGFHLETVISYSSRGFYQGVQKWGGELMKEHGKTTARRESDNTVNYLGYWTDNGAFYYYNTEPNKDYGETMMDIYGHLHDDIKAPVRSWNYDSWFYYKCTWYGPPVNGHHHGSAVKNWTAMPEVFPNGMNDLYQDATLPVIAHNRSGFGRHS